MNSHRTIALLTCDPSSSSTPMSTGFVVPFSPFEVLSKWHSHTAPQCATTAAAASARRGHRGKGHGYPAASVQVSLTVTGDAGGASDVGARHELEDVQLVPGKSTPTKTSPASVVDVNALDRAGHKATAVVARNESKRKGGHSVAGTGDMHQQVLKRSRHFVSKLRRLPANSSTSWRIALRELDVAERAETLMRKAGLPAAEAAVTVYMYGACITHMARCYKYQEAIDILYRMRDRGVLPNEYCVSSALHACGRAGKWQLCLKLLGEARGWGANVNNVGYNAAIAACATGLQWQQAVHILRRMQALDIPPTARTYSSVITACGKCGKLGEALGLLREMPRHGVTPNVYTYNMAISACPGEKWETAIDLLGEIRTLGLQPDTYRCEICELVEQALTTATGCFHRHARILLSGHASRVIKVQKKVSG